MAFQHQFPYGEKANQKDATITVFTPLLYKRNFNLFDFQEAQTYWRMNLTSVTADRRT